LKTHQMFPALQYAGNLRFVFGENSDREIEIIHDRNVVIFEKFRFQNVFTKSKASVFLRFEERFRKAPFSLGLTCILNILRRSVNAPGA